MSLEFESTEDLLEELAKRFDASCFVGRKNIITDESGLQVSIVGDASEILGMLTLAEHKTVSLFKKSIIKPKRKKRPGGDFG